ncbi:MAG: hypothetical protein WD717_06530 [Nitrosarchaeum sp.]
MSKNDDNIQPSSNCLDNLQNMMETLISLQGRQTFSNDMICEIVMKGKQNPEDYVKGYNLCDGEHSMSEVAEIIKITLGTLSPILADWKEKGIIYEIKKKGGKFYKKLYSIKPPKTKQKNKQNKLSSENISTETDTSMNNNVNKKYGETLGEHNNE